MKSLRNLPQAHQRSCVSLFSVQVVLPLAFVPLEVALIYACGLISFSEDQKISLSPVLKKCNVLFAGEVVHLR